MEIIKMVIYIGMSSKCMSNCIIKTIFWTYCEDLILQQAISAWFYICLSSLTKGRKYVILIFICYKIGIRKKMTFCVWHLEWYFSLPLATSHLCFLCLQIPFWLVFIFKLRWDPWSGKTCLEITSGSSKTFIC